MLLNITEVTVIQLRGYNSTSTLLKDTRYTRHCSILCITWQTGLAQMKFVICKSRLAALAGWNTYTVVRLHWLIWLSRIVPTVGRFFNFHDILSISCILVIHSFTDCRHNCCVWWGANITIWLAGQTFKMETACTTIISSVYQTAYLVQEKLTNWLQQLIKGSLAVMLKWTSSFFTYCPQLVLHVTVNESKLLLDCLE